MNEPDGIDLHDQAVERELIREANERAKEKGNRTAKACEDMRQEAGRKLLDMWVSLGLIALMTLLLLTPKALRWIYFLWR